MFNEPALNCFSEELKSEREKYAHYHLIKEVKLETFPLKEIFDKYLPINQNIDFLSIDVEGLDYQVLKSNDWNKYRPKIILVEEFNFNIENKEDLNIYKYIQQMNYFLFAKTVNTLIFKSK